MKPVQKAEELILKYLRIDNNTKEWFNKHIAKQCALIAVDEIIESIEFSLINHPDSKYLIEKLNFYDSVQQEIKKL